MWLHRTLLWLYPASFRAEYGSELTSLFARRRRDVRGPAVALLWAGEIADTLATAARVHVDLLGQDLRQTARVLARAPGFATTAVLVAALGIGATTSAFSITDHVLLQPLPFRDPDRLVSLWEDQTFRGYPHMELSPGNYDDWARLSQTVRGMAAYATRSGNLVGSGEPERLDGASVTPNLFATLGVGAVIGRTFSPSEDRQGAPATILLSHQLWQSRFAASTSVLGQILTVDGEPFVVAGVLPAWFNFPRRGVDFWVPLHFDAGDFEDRSNTYLRVVGRLVDGVTIDAARADMSRVALGLARAFPDANAKTGAAVAALGDAVPWQSRMLLMGLVGASLCVLLLSCTNLASLLLTRALGRSRELAVRAALGAGRERLVRQMLTESVVLAAAGGALGVLLAYLAAPLVVRLVPTSLPISEIPGINGRVLGFSLGVTLVTGLGFGMIPALRAGRGMDPTALRDGARAGVSRRTERLRSALVVAQVTASVVLLVASGLLIRALWRVSSVDPGFDADGVLTLRTTLPLPRYAPTMRREAFYRQVLDEVQALPGVSHAAYISFLPMTMRGGIWPVEPTGHVSDTAESRVASLRFVTPGFFATVGTPLVIGRDVDVRDTRDTPFVAVVSQSFVRAYVPGGNPIGWRFTMAFQERTVVGVVGDIRVRGLEQDSEPQVYVPSGQVPDGGLPLYNPKDLVIRSSAPAGTIVPAVREIVRRADPEEPVSDVQTLAAVVASDTAPRLVQVRVLAGFAAVACLLAAVGIHSLLALALSMRRREVGIRMALGANRPEIFLMMLRRGLRLASAGIIPGLLLAYLGGRALQAVLAGISPADGITFGAAAGVAILVAVAGSLVPALRAMRIDPLTVIRAD
jgi:putative ABC transport system permease protein